MKKRVLIKAYTRDRKYLGVIPQADISSFAKEINGGLGECLLTLGVKFDSSDVYFQEGNHFEIWISDIDTVNEQDAFRKIYAGYVSMIEPVIETANESIIIHLIGYQTLLGLDVMGLLPFTTIRTIDPAGIDDAYDPTLRPASNCDIGLIVRGIINQFQIESGSTAIKYTAESVPVFSAVMAYLFIQKTYQESLEEVRSVAPKNTYSYLDENGLFSFKVAGTVSHKLTFKKNIGNVKIKRSIEELRNVILIWDGLDEAHSVIYQGYQNAESVSKYGRRVERFTNSSVTDLPTANLIAEKFLAENSQPIVSITCDVFDNAEDENGYDIESINPGDSVTFFNLDTQTSSILREQMIVTSVTYAFSKATITVQPIRSGVVDILNRLTDAIKNIQNIQSMPSSYLS